MQNALSALAALVGAFIAAIIGIVIPLAIGLVPAASYAAAKTVGSVLVGRWKRHASPEDRQERA